jgi:hypothetical protein
MAATGTGSSEPERDGTERGAARGAAAEAIAAATPAFDTEDLEDLEEAPDNEVEEAEVEILDQATAACTIGELKAGIATLGRLESLALARPP